VPPYSPVRETSIEERLQRVAYGRDIHPWLKGLGLSSGTISRLRHGHLPAPERLVPIARTERVSLSWLIDGRGPPFLVHHFQAASSLRLFLDELLVEAGVHACLVHAGEPGFCAAVFMLPAELVLGADKVLPYTVVEVVVGPFARGVLPVPERGEVYAGFGLLQVAPDVLRRLARGAMGNPELLAHIDDGAQVCAREDWEDLVDRLCARAPRAVAEPAPPAYTGQLDLALLERLEVELAELAQALAPAQRARVISLLYEHYARTGAPVDIDHLRRYVALAGGEGGPPA
jgi:hypothetical protein